MSAACASLLTATAGHAQKKPRTSVIAVLPLAAQDTSTAIYGVPVAKEVARHLSKRLGDDKDITIEALESSDAVPARVAFLIDGRIVLKSSKRVLLEAQIRDADSGARVAVVATSAKSLTKIDRLAAEIGRKLAPALTRAVAERKETERDPIVMPETVIEGDKRKSSAGNKGADKPDPERRASAERAAPDTRPLLVVFGRYRPGSRWQRTGRRGGDPHRIPAGRRPGLSSSRQPRARDRRARDGNSGHAQDRRPLRTDAERRIHRLLVVWSIDGSRQDTRTRGERRWPGRGTITLIPPIRSSAAAVIATRSWSVSYWPRSATYSTPS